MTEPFRVKIPSVCSDDLRAALLDLEESDQAEVDNSAEM